ncbi:MAG: peptidoglycan bridge formation glycyltransferase FemA/FemB family protein [Anaerolineales bacterium]
MTISESVWLDFLQSTTARVHLLQTPAWGELKRGFGWYPRRLIVGQCGAQVLFRKLLPGVRIAYLPKGPVGIPGADFWQALDDLCRQEGAIFLKIEPDAWEDAPPSFQGVPHPGANPVSQAIQPRRTLVVDLTPPEADILAAMKQKTRYNIRLAGRKEVVVQESDNLGAFYDLMRVTGGRDGFGVHQQAYYQRAYDLFRPLDACALLMATYQGQPLAALMVFAWGGRAWYLYGASNDQERNRMPAYLVQWEAMRWAKAHGCTEYDLWGVPDADDAQLEAEFSGRSDGLWGVYRFKRGFGGQLRRAAAPLDVVYRPAFYRLYCRLTATG